MNENELSGLNQIDTECKYYDDDDSSFSSIKIKSNKDVDADADNYKKETGVIIDLSDDPISRAKTRYNERSFDTPVSMHGEEQNVIEPKYEGYNAIDTECAYYDDTEEPDFSEKEGSDLTGLVEEDMITEKRKALKKKPSNILQQVQKKHAATIKKGAYNSHFHFSGNPEKEAAMFNDSVDFSAPANFSPVGPASGGMGESLKKNKNKNRELLEEMFSIIGFDVIPNSDGTINAFDNCDSENDIDATDINDLIEKLSPYINMCIIYPLEAKTGQSFENYAGWCDWYKNNENKYPNCKSDIEYCDLLANKLGECDF